MAIEAEYAKAYLAKAGATGDRAQQEQQEGKFLPKEYEERIYGAVNGLCFLRKFFDTSADEIRMDLGEQLGAAWILKQITDELMDTALNCSSIRRA